MCVCCTEYVRRLLRIVRATEARRFRSWQAETWFKTVVDASNGLIAMPEADYNALNIVQTYFSNAISGGLRVWQTHSMATPTERADPPSPTGVLMPAPPKPILPGPPMPKAVSADASAEQGGEGPPRSSLSFPPQESEVRQRSEVPAGEGAKEDGGQTTTEVIGRDAEIEELRQQVRALQAQASAVQSLPVQDLTVQGSVVGKTRPGVIPSRDQSGVDARTGLQSKAPGLRSKSAPSPLLGCRKEFKKLRLGGVLMQ